MLALILPLGHELSAEERGHGPGSGGRSNNIFSVKVRLLVGVKIEGLNFSAVMQLL
jgi:hypothetical protein